MILLHPHKTIRPSTDPHTRELMLKTVEFFENRGKAKLKQDDHDRVWYKDFLEFIAKEQVFASLLTPPAYGGPACRWDTYRNCEFNEILGFYGLPYWYTWQVSILGLGPLWMSKNEAIKIKTAAHLKAGGIFGFGLSEKEHGADLYSSEMTLTPESPGHYKANGRKYYIGNANEAALLSTFGKMSAKKTEGGDYVFFATDPKREGFELVKNVVNSQNYVAEYALHDYAVSEAEILSKGQEAWDCSLNTINVGKFNLGWASIGMCTHALYEAINHASHRKLFGHTVTDFTHIKHLFTDSYARLTAMKLFALRASDYMRSATLEDRRYLLYNPMVKMKVTTQGEEVINLLWDVIAAKGFEKDTIFESVARDIRALPKLEGTVHVNMALIIKFMGNYFFKPGKLPAIGKRDEPVHDEFLFKQGPTKGLSKIRFHDYRIAYNSVNLPNVDIFKKQIRILKTFLLVAKPSKKQTEDIDFLLILGELFTLVVYGQLLIESAKIQKTEGELLDQIFDFMIRDFSKFALQLYSKTSSTTLQQFLCLQMIKKPKVNPERTDRIWRNHVESLKDGYEMKA
ncbi:acyl-CoA dehydrogenase [Bdellovibrionota bacterium FG-2]